MPDAHNYGDGTMPVPHGDEQGSGEEVFLAASAIEQEWSTVPSSYKVDLLLIDPVPKRDSAKGIATEHRMTVTGTLHPKEYGHHNAQRLLEQKLQPLLDIGWRIERSFIRGYGTRNFEN